MQFKSQIMVAWCGILALSGCQATYHANQVEQSDKDALRLGAVQREISIGMPSSEVIEALGSPNIVSTDGEGREVWIYDKHATQVVASSSRWFVSAGASSKTQRTLTVIVKMDKENRVRDLAYHSSSF